MASRYSGPRYDGDSRRSRSRDRSPDRRSLYSDGGPRRSSAESRANTSAFQNNRDSFRDTLPRDTPSAPKALRDARDHGHHRGGYSNEFRGRGRGRGRGWRDDSRDRGRDHDINFRDRRDTSYRDERSRERDRPDWRERDRDSFRGRRPSPHGRSPPGREFRDARDARDGPLGVDAERARRGSRDGPLSAGSSSSDPPFNTHLSYRGGYGRGRGRGRGGDWDRGRGRHHFDDRDRYGAPFRSRSQEGRFPREDRDRDNRYNNTDRLPIPRDEYSRDNEPRLNMDRKSYEPPSTTKDVSPPPVAPAAPSFGSVPNRTNLGTDIGSLTGKAPPTGPRAYRDDRPAPIGISSAADGRPPPTGPAKTSFMERSPQALSAPSRPSSKQWINPALKSRVPESPKLGRSQSFAQQGRPAGLRPDGDLTDQLNEYGQRPRSSDAKADPQAIKNDVSSRDPYAGGLGDDSKPGFRLRSADSHHDHGYKFSGETTTIHHDSDSDQEPGEIVTPTKSEHIHHYPENPKTRLDVQFSLKALDVEIDVPQVQEKQLVMDQSSESDDDEEFGDIIESEMIGVEKELKQLDTVEDAAPIDAIVRYALITLEAVTQIATVAEGLEEMVGPVPEKAPATEKTPPKSDTQIDDQPAVQELLHEISGQEQNQEQRPSSPASKDVSGSSTGVAELPKPSIEQDGEDTTTQEASAKAATGENKPMNEDGDVTMEDATDSHGELETRPTTSMLPIPILQGERLLPSFDEAQMDSHDASKAASTTPSPPEDEDDTDIEDIDLRTIEIVREHLQTPPLDTLPFLDEKPWDKDKVFLKSIDTAQPALDGFILQKLKSDALSQLAVDEKAKQEYGENYDRYIRFTMSDDEVAVKSREKFTFIPGASDPVTPKPGFTVEPPKPESTRRSRYASERDLERVLEESRRVEDEKKERQQQAEREKYRTNKEAVIPCQYRNDSERDNDFYEDTTGLVQPEKIVATWEVLPPVDNFTEEEYGIFEKAYLEFPKQWGRVAEPLRERDFGTSIQFYYLKKEKEELNLKEKLKKQPKRRKKGGRSKARSSALVSELGNGENDNDESQEIGENGERRRPRRAAAPTFNSEATPATDGEGGTPAGTPGRRGAAAREGGDSRKRGRRPKGQEPKQARGAVALAPTPNLQQTPTAARGNRSRSTSRVQNPEWIVQSLQDDGSRLPPQYELPTNPGHPGPPMIMQSPFSQQSLLSPDRGMPPPEAMAPPPLRPEPPQPPVTVLDMSQPSASDRKSGGQPSSYWSVPEASEFPSLLRSFGSDWGAIASHMRTKTAVMVKNYYTRRKDGNDWETLVREADDRKYRGEKRPPPPTLTTSVKKGRPLAAADAIMEDAPQTKLEHIPTSQSMTGRFNIPIAASPQPSAGPPPFVQPTQSPAITLVPQPVSQPLVQAPAQTMSPGSRPVRAPLPFAEREHEREPSFVQHRTPLVSKPHAVPPSDPAVRQPLPGSLIDPQSERQKAEPKAPKDALRHQERPPLRVKQESETLPHDYYGGVHSSMRGPPSRIDNIPLSSRTMESPRPSMTAPPAPYAALQHQSRSFIGEPTPSSPAPPRPLPNLSRPMSSTSGGDPYHAPPPQQTPIPSIPPPPSRAPKTSNLMALLNDDTPAPTPKRTSEVAAVPKSSATPPPQPSLSRPPPPPPPPSHVRRDSAIQESQAYGYGRNPPPAPPYSMPSLKPSTASPQAQHMNATRHMPLDRAADRESYFGVERSRSFAPTAGSPQNTPHYQPPPQSTHVQYQSPSPYAYGASVQSQVSNATSPPPQYAPHHSNPRHHEPSPSNREVAWAAPNQRQHMQHPHPHQQAQQAQQPAAWSSHPSQNPKVAQPQPAPSAWGEQHGVSKSAQPGSSISPQPPWPGTQQPRGHDPMAMRDVYQSSRMQPLSQGPYPSSSRAPEPPPQAPAGYPRFSNPPVSGRDPRDPRDPGPPRSYTPVGGYDGRAFPPQGDMREAHLREQQQQQQQQSVLQQQLRPPDNRHMYDRPPLDRYGR